MSTHISSAQQGQYVQVNGLNIYYEEYGSGEPLLLIHGGLVNLTMWAQHIPIFAQHFKVIAPDSRGHGRTKNPIDTISYRLLADDMVAFIRALGLDQPLVCGYSDGGQIALEMGMNYPKLAKAYVVGGATYQWPEVYFHWIKELGMESPSVVNIEQFERAHPDLVQLLLAHQDAFQGHDFWKTYVIQLSRMWLAPLHYTDEDLKKIGEPTLILAGDRDDVFLPVEQAVDMYRMIPRAELAIAPGADHFVAWSRVELFTQLIMDFLLRQSLGGE